MLSPSQLLTRPLAVRPAFPFARISLSRLRTPALVAVLSLPYLAVGLALSIGAGIITPDSWSRVGNAWYVLFSRDPHLAAIGFVWNPLPSLLELPILPLALIWRPLVDHGVAGCLMSAVCMGFAVREVLLWLRELGLGRARVAGLTLAFAVNPLIVLYGGNGMSEAPFLLFLIVAGRAFSSWVAGRDLARLVVTGMALAFAYLTRYEAVAAIAGIAALTMLIAFRRAGGSRQDRLREALSDGLVVASPPVGAFAAWAVASWIIVGSPFATFTSTYGNSSQVDLAISGIRAAVGQTPGAALWYVLEQIAGLEPMLPIILALGLVTALLRRDVRLLVPLALFGSVLGFSALLVVAGGSFGWLRFQITAIPLAVIVAGVVVSSVAATRPDRHRAQLAAMVAGSRRAIVVGIVGLALVGLPWGIRTIFNPMLAREELPQLAGFVAGDGDMPAAKRQFLVGREIARYLDGQSLAPGSVVIDVAVGFPIVLQSADPAQFVITPDRDFERVLADPVTFSAEYMLVPNPVGYAAVDKVGRTYPTLYQDGAGIATLVTEFGDGDPTSEWRLYEVTK
jgi:hypothetical protein